VDDDVIRITGGFIAGSFSRRTRQYIQGTFTTGVSDERQQDDFSVGHQ
jgi:hypothetical protein